MPPPPLAVAVRHRNWRKVDVLLQNGADVQAALRRVPKNDFLGRVQLAKRARDCKGVRTLRLLLRRGAEVDPVNNKGETPLAIAARFHNWPAAKVLLEHGASLRMALSKMPENDLYGRRELIKCALRCGVNNKK